MSGYLEAKSFIESEDFWMVSCKEKVGNSSTPEKNVSRRVVRVCFVLGMRRRLQTFILLMSLCPHIMGIQGHNVGRDHL